MARHDEQPDGDRDDDGDDGLGDGPIRPDDVTASPPNDRLSGVGFSGDEFSGDGDLDDERSDLDRLARRAVDSVLHLVRRANALAGGVLMLAVVFSIGGFLLGLAALSDGIRTVWIVVGGFFAIVAIGSVITAMLRLRAVRRSADRLITEVRALISGDHAHRRTVIETVRTTEGNDDDGIVHLSRQFFSMRGAVGNRVGQFRELTSALVAIMSFPALIAIATLISIVFAGLCGIFLIALLL